jgi:predicted molibdopterin-dependent oxidoreductase YjgC
VGDLLAALGEAAVYFLPADVFRALAVAHPPFAGMTYETLGLRGSVVSTGAGSPAVAAAPT